MISPQPSRLRLHDRYPEEKWKNHWTDWRGKHSEAENQAGTGRNIGKDQFNVSNWNQENKIWKNSVSLLVNQFTNRRNPCLNLGLWYSQYKPHKSVIKEKEFLHIGWRIINKPRLRRKLVVEPKNRSAMSVVLPPTISSVGEGFHSFKGSIPACSGKEGFLYRKAGRKDHFCRKQGSSWKQPFFSRSSLNFGWDRLLPTGRSVSWCRSFSLQFCRTDLPGKNETHRLAFPN